MKINVERTTSPEGNLVFTIIVSEPHFVPFEENHKNTLENIDKFTESMEIYLNFDQLLYDDLKRSHELIKKRVFTRVLENLKFSIENELKPKFNPICQEIYNWIYDHQRGYVKKWLEEFDPQRSKYYFDNDISKFELLDRKPNITSQDIDEDDYDVDEDNE